MEVSTHKTVLNKNNTSNPLPKQEVDIGDELRYRQICRELRMLAAQRVPLTASSLTPLSHPMRTANCEHTAGLYNPFIISYFDMFWGPLRLDSVNGDSKVLTESCRGASAADGGGHPLLPAEGYLSCGPLPGRSISIVMDYMGGGSLQQLVVTPRAFLPTPIPF